MISSSNELVQRLWSYCNLLRDDGFSNSEYIEQLTYLLFLKMAEERSKPPFLDLEPLPEAYSWSALRQTEGELQLELYQRALIRLGARQDLFGIIYRNAISRFRDPLKFKRLVAEIDQLEWSKYDSDIKGDAYEGLLERTAADTKSGAGQYFTPRPLVEAIVEVMQPTRRDSVCDPACGTGGFLLSWILHPAFAKIPSEERRSLFDETVSGVELVESVARLCLMNLVLHGVGGKRNPVAVADSLAETPHNRYSVVLANPPFGRKSMVSVANGAGERDGEVSVRRKEFWATTSNKQLNFLQHVYTLLNDDGRAAIIVPDNVLFEGGAGEVIRRKLLASTNVHTLLRLPTGIFYAQGIKANVLFFDRASEERDRSGRLWIYDFRTNKRFTLKESPLTRSDLEAFVDCYSGKDRSKRVESERFRSFGYEELLARDKASLDISWLRDESLEDSSLLPTPDVLVGEILDDLAVAQAQFAALLSSDVSQGATS